ncbi:MAG: hypothetical protein ABII81_06265 [Pseudomonadota bacterium]
MLPKVPSCEKCNNEKSQLEHYLLSILPFGATHQNAEKALSIDAKKRLENNKKLHNEIRKGFSYQQIPIMGGGQEKRLTVELDSDALHEFVGYIGRGLIWHHWGRYLPLNCSFKIFTPSPVGIEFVSGFFNLHSNRRVDIELGNNTVRYKGVMSEIDDGLSMWAIQMLGGITVSDKNQSFVFSNSFVAMITGSPEMLNKLNVE